MMGIVELDAHVEVSFYLFPCQLTERFGIQLQVTGL